MLVSNARSIEKFVLSGRRLTAGPLWGMRRMEIQSALKCARTDRRAGERFVQPPSEWIKDLLSLVPAPAPNIQSDSDSAQGYSDTFTDIAFS
jgi:hypothetical protein